jgi:hypothetical protein
MVLACPKGIDVPDLWDSLEDQADRLRVAQGSGVQVGNTAEGYVTITLMKRQADTAEEYASNPDLDEEFRIAAPQLIYFLVNYDREGLVRATLAKLLQRLDRENLFWVDVDDGHVVRGSDFLRSG